jgi:hypothetical protein
MLIRAYGEFWNPEAVPWPQSQMKGRFKLAGGATVTTDAWDQIAIYALQQDFRTVYVGRGHLGPRLKAHLSDRHAGRWDMFSWYGLKIILRDGSLRGEPAKRLLTFETIQKGLEALAIGLVDPPLNRRREALRGAFPVEQSSTGSPRAIRSYLEEIATNAQRIP